MKKGWKIFWLVALILVFLFVSSITYEVYRELTFYNTAKDLGLTSALGGKAFNSELKDCSPSYGGVFSSEKWEIRGLENEKCIITYKIANLSDMTESGEITYIPAMTCNLPKEIYSYPENMNAMELINRGYCEILRKDLFNFPSDEIDITNEPYKETENNPTEYDLKELPYLSQIMQGEFAYTNFETNILIECKDDMIVSDTALTTRFFFGCDENRNRIVMSLPEKYMAQLARENKTPLKLTAFYNFDKYGANEEQQEFNI